MLKKVNVTQSNRSLIFTNRICCYSDKPTILKVEIDEKTNLIVEFNFYYNEDKDQRLDVRPESINKVNVSVYNFNNPLGTGLKNPIGIAKFNDKTIYLVFFVYKIKECNPILDVSLYMEN